MSQLPTTPQPSGLGMPIAVKTPVPAAPASSTGVLAPAEISAEKRYESRYAVRLAVVAACVSVVTALIALLGVWYSTTQETDRSRAEFVRSQREALYAQVGKADFEATRTENFLIDDLSEYSSPRTEPAPEASFKTCAAALSNLESLGLSVQVVASEHFTADFISVVESHKAVCSAIMDPISVTEEYRIAQASEAQGRVGRARDNLADAARTDLG